MSSHLAPLVLVLCLFGASACGRVDGALLSAAGGGDDGPRDVGLGTDIDSTDADVLGQGDAAIRPESDVSASPDLPVSSCGRSPVPTLLPTDLGLCLCDGATVGGDLRVEGSSGQGNAALMAGGYSRVYVSGNLHIGDGTYLGALDLEGDLEAAGGVALAGRVEGDMACAGDLEVLDAGLSVGGRLRLADTADVDGGPLSAELERGPVVVDAPCLCSASDALADTIFFARSDNDNETVGESLNTFNDVGSLQLPCGLYYLDQVDIARQVTIRALGEVTLVVDGPFDAAGLALEVADGASLDVIVTGAAHVAGSFRMGDASTRERIRLLLHGPVEFDVRDTSSIFGRIYGPEAVLKLPVTSVLYGRVLVGKIESNRTVTIRHEQP